MPRCPRARLLCGPSAGRDPALDPSGPARVQEAPAIPKASPQFSFRRSRRGYIARGRFGFDQRMGKRRRIGPGDCLVERRGHPGLCRLDRTFCSEGQTARAANSLLITANLQCWPPIHGPT